MAPPAQGLDLNIQAISGIAGSISIASWVVVFSAQIYENFKRQSADGLSLLFLAIWLAGDLFNILGGAIQGVIPTIVILAVYYTLADVVLLCQVFYYRGSGPGLSIQRCEQDEGGAGDGERQALLDNPPPKFPRRHLDARRDSSTLSLLSNFISNEEVSKLSSATPFLPPDSPLLLPHSSPPVKTLSNSTESPSSPAFPSLEPFLINTFSILLVIGAGVLGWRLTQHQHTKSHHKHHHHQRTQPVPSIKDPALSFSPLGQTFGYLCSLFYLGSRIPQILHNYHWQSCEGVSLLFFLFACLGNLSFVLSIVAFAPICAGDIGCCEDGEQRLLYLRYIAVNASWLIGSLGTLALDLIIFGQFFWYRSAAPRGVSEDALEEDT